MFFSFLGAPPEEWANFLIAFFAEEMRSGGAEGASEVAGGFKEAPQAGPGARIVDETWAWLLFPSVVDAARALARFGARRERGEGGWGDARLSAFGAGGRGEAKVLDSVGVDAPVTRPATCARVASRLIRFSVA